MSGCRVGTSLLLCGYHCTYWMFRLLPVETIVNKDAGGIPRQVSSSGAGSRMGEMPGVSA